MTEAGKHGAASDSGANWLGAASQQAETARNLRQSVNAPIASLPRRRKMAEAAQAAIEIGLKEAGRRQKRHMRNERRVLNTRRSALGWLAFRARLRLRLLQITVIVVKFLISLVVISGGILLVAGALYALTKIITALGAG